MSSAASVSSLTPDNAVVQQQLEDGDARFGKFRISKDSIFYRSNLSIAFVNLRPIVPGHVLVMSQRIVPLLSDLNEEEYTDLWNTVRIVQRILQNQQQQSSTNTLSFNVAVQDGMAAGQSVPHVHVHILPRQQGDYKINDHVYEDLEQWEPTNEKKKYVDKLNVPSDQERRDRTAQEMAQEAALYRTIVQSMKK